MKRLTGTALSTTLTGMGLRRLFLIIIVGIVVAIIVRAQAGEAVLSSI